MLQRRLDADSGHSSNKDSDKVIEDSVCSVSQITESEPLSDLFEKKNRFFAVEVGMPFSCVREVR